VPDARAGFAWTPVLGGNFALRVAGDLSGLNRGDENFFKKTHFGAEAEFAKRLFVRGGFNQGYPSAGVDFRWPFLRVSYFFTGEERGRYPGQMGTFKHSLELDFVATVIRRMLRKKVGRVAGRIADAGTGEALSGVVMLADSALGPMAEAAEPYGEYTLSLPSERVHRLKAMAEGYEPEVKEVEVATGGTYALDFDLNRKHYPRGDVVGRITDARDGRPVGGFVSAAAGDSGLGQAEADSTTGIYHLALPPGTYTLTARSPGYRDLALPGAVQNSEVTTLDFGLAALPRVGEHIILRGIGFRTGSARILEESYPVLDEAARIFIENPTLVAEVGGHTDSRGSARRNQDLSERRAYSVREYLTEKFQLAPERLIARGYGKDRPVDTNMTREGRKANRRIEFVILAR
jgi:outer membrane protein OmpA-like peptidoglycan-associated protein